MRGGERLLNLLENLPDTMLEEAWKIEKVQNRKIRKIFYRIVAIACLVVLFMAFVPAGQTMAAWIRESIEYLLEQWFPPREISVHPEGEEENSTHEIYGDLPKQSESIPQETESATEAGFAIYFDPEIFETEEQGEDYVIRQKQFLYTREDAINDLHKPICEIRITQIQQTTPEEAAAKTREDFLVKYENMSEITKSSLLDGLYLYGNTGLSADSEVVEAYFVDNGIGGVFVIKAVYYMEATEGVGARFHAMIETFEVLLPEVSLKDLEFESAALNNAENSEESEKSEEVQNLQQKMEDFCQAYFNGDSEAVQGFLSESFTWDVEVYEGSEDVEDIDMRDITGLKDVSELAASEKYILSKPFIIPGEDTMTYLTVIFINEDGEWKVSGYGLEK